MMPEMMTMLFLGVLGGFIWGVIVAVVFLAPDGKDKK